MVHVGPVRVLDLRDKLGLQPAAFGHLVGGQTLTPPVLVALWQVRKWQVLISSLWKRSKPFARVIVLAWPTIRHRSANRHGMKGAQAPLTAARHAPAPKGHDLGL